MKLIKVKCFEPISTYKDYKQPWSDVWIRYTGKPNRKVYKYSLTLISRPSLEIDLKVSSNCHAKYPTYGFDEEVKQCEEILEFFENGGHIFVEKNIPYNVDTQVFTSKDYVDREEADKMIREFTKTIGFDKVRLKWLRSKAMVTPIG